MRRYETMLMCTALLVSAMAGTAAAVPTVGFDLVVTNLDANSATLDVVIDYDADPDTAGLVFVQLDVGASTDNLTNNGTDYSRLSFAPSAALALWSPFGPQTNFGAFSDLTYQTFDPAGALLEGQHTIGTITVNLAGLAGQLVAIGLILPNDSFLGTDVGQETPPGNTQSFELFIGEQIGTVNIDTERFTVPQGEPTGDIPEPATAALALMGLAGLARRSRRQA